MEYGLYRKTSGKTGVGMLYQFLALARHHTTGVEFVMYIPLRLEKDWIDTVRPCVLERFDFELKFQYVGERLPADFGPQA